MEILELYDLSEDDMELPSEWYRRLLKRNFVPLKEILESERRAMEITMELERRRLEKKYGPNGSWRVEDVSLREHYDVKITEPGGEERYIEVKGHKPFLLTAELTPAEYEFATEHRDRYWIYIVANLGGRPVILKVFKPFDKSHSRVYAVLEDGREVEVTGTISIDIESKIRKTLMLKYPRLGSE